VVVASPGPKVGTQRIAGVISLLATVDTNGRVWRESLQQLGVIGAGACGRRFGLISGTLRKVERSNGHP
jgi:hypothetical protein